MTEHTESRPAFASDTTKAPLSSLQFSTRFHRALSEPPVARVFYDTDWDPRFIQKLAKVQEVDEKRQICAHDINHLVRVAENAFVLSDQVRMHFAKQQPDEIPHWERVFADANVLVPILTHDLGYASDNTQWQKLHGLNHAQESVTIFDQFINTAPPESTRNIEAFGEIFRRAIDSDEAALREQLNEIGKISPESLFPLVIQTSDKLDYFHVDRVKKLSAAPAIFEDNPYFFLSDAVLGYQLRVTDSSIGYEVALKPAYQVPSALGLVELSFSLWRDLAVEQHPKVWNLAQAVATACDKIFILRKAEDSKTP